MIRIFPFLLFVSMFSFSQKNGNAYKYSDQTLDSIIDHRLISLRFESLKQISNHLYVDDDIFQYTIFCKWIVNTLEYDENTFNNRSVKSLFKMKKGNCSVYSTFLDSLCFYRGLKSKYLRGYVKGEFGLKPQRHAWNSVIIRDTMYYTDLTWCDNKNRLFGESNFTRGFFLVKNHQLFALDHFADKRKFRGIKQSYKAFMRAPLFFSLFNNLVNDSINLQPLISRNKECELRFHLDRLDSNYIFEDLVISSSVSVESKKDHIDERPLLFKIVDGNLLVIENFKLTEDSAYLFIGVRNKKIKNRIERFALMAW